MLTLCIHHEYDEWIRVDDQGVPYLLYHSCQNDEGGFIGLVSSRKPLGRRNAWDVVPDLPNGLQCE